MKTTNEEVFQEEIKAIENCIETILDFNDYNDTLLNKQSIKVIVEAFETKLKYQIDMRKNKAR